jgi:hypothetical protein
LPVRVDDWHQFVGPNLQNLTQAGPCSVDSAGDGAVEVNGLQIADARSGCAEPIGRVGNPLNLRERIYLELAKRKERTRAVREWSVSRIRRARTAEVQGKTREPIPPRQRKPHPKPNLAALLLHQLVRALR